MNDNRNNYSHKASLYTITFCIVTRPTRTNTPKRFADMNSNDDDDDDGDDDGNDQRDNASVSSESETNSCVASDELCPAKGEKVKALYEGDGKWYRAKVTKVSKRRVYVEYREDDTTDIFLRDDVELRLRRRLSARTTTPQTADLTPKRKKRKLVQRNRSNSVLTETVSESEEADNDATVFDTPLTPTTASQSTQRKVLVEDDEDDDDGTNDGGFNATATANTITNTTTNTVKLQQNPPFKQEPQSSPTLTLSQRSQRRTIVLDDDDDDDDEVDGQAELERLFGMAQNVEELDDDDDDESDSDDDEFEPALDDDGNPKIEELDGSDDDDSDDDSEDDEEQAKKWVEEQKQKLKKRPAPDDDSDDDSEDDNDDAERGKTKKAKTAPTPIQDLYAKTKKQEAVKLKEKKVVEKKPEPKKQPPQQQTLKGGVKVTDTVVGTGREAKQGDRVGMYYRGFLIKNKKQFDACQKGKPFDFKIGIGEVIKGWDIGVKGMKVGGKRTLYLPANVGYGKRGAPPDIPKNADLGFEVELKKIF
eukprot:m.132239 g.132239  ORF g.132239 m.132239 type:complete len:533 (+) comp29597_c0_seq4:222-1820(+)